MEKPEIIKRLSYIKQLYLIGLKQSRQHESIAVFSILTFQDSIEMFLKLLSEKLNVNATKFSFMDYWTKINTLTLKESMRNLNSRRVNIKHKGLLPAKSEIEISRVNSFEFFEQNCEKHFGIKFSEISLINLIHYQKVREYLDYSEECFKEGKLKDSIVRSAFAFNELLYSYENTKSSWGRSPFFIGKDMSWSMSSTHEFRYSENKEAKILLKELTTVRDSVKELQKVMNISALGIDYKEYVKFKILTPRVLRTHDNELRAGDNFEKPKLTKESCEYCLNFVIDNALSLQESEFDINHLLESEE